MKVAVLKETFPGENRVALVPAHLAPLKKANLEVIVERGAGLAAGYPDEQYQQAGATLVASRADALAQADIVAAVRAFGGNLGIGSAAGGGTTNDALRAGQTWIGFCDPLGEPAALQGAAAAGLSVYAMELIPRTTRAQSMDALSSMAMVAGYKSVLLGAAQLPKMFPMMMTAAGTVTPAKVFVMGAGVAGLQAIATARRLGAVVLAYDVRPVAKQEVESLGARFLELPLETKDAQAAGGYARAQDEEFLRRQRQLTMQALADQDMVVTTAAVPGRKAPILITREMVEVMPPGSVLVDLAAERGGNCELTKPGETVVHNGVTILGPINLPATIPFHASQLYGKNVTTLLLHLIKQGFPSVNTSDDVIDATLAVHGGEIRNPMMREKLNLPPLLPKTTPQGSQDRPIPLAETPAATPPAVPTPASTPAPPATTAPAETTPPPTNEPPAAGQ
jgi:NAD(P) transhydrogenase subunit alpha